MDTLLINHYYYHHFIIIVIIIVVVVIVIIIFNWFIDFIYYRYLFPFIWPLQRSMVAVKGAEVQILLKKRNHAVWTRLLRSKEKVRKYDA